MEFDGGGFMITALITTGLVAYWVLSCWIFCWNITSAWPGHEVDGEDIVAAVFIGWLSAPFLLVAIGLRKTFNKP